jgi:hypothetical protein
MYGYRVGEVKLPSFDGQKFDKDGGQYIDSSSRITRFIPTYNRPPVAVSLGPVVTGACLPHPDPGHSESLVQGALYRFARKIDYEDEFIKEFGEFVDSWCNRNITPLEPNTDVSIESWLEKTGYSDLRKKELLKAFEESNLRIGDDVPDKYLELKSFMKDEHYPEYKFPRPINSRSDVFKVLVGPYVQCMNELLLKMPYFIKKIPVSERAQFVKKNL